MWPEALMLDRFLRRARARLVGLRLVEGAAAGAILATFLSVAGSGSIAVAVFAISLAAVLRLAFADDWHWGWWRSLPHVARQVEGRTTEGRNLLLTAAELPRDQRTYINDIVVKRAGQIAGKIDLARVFPVGGAATVLLLGILALVMSITRPVRVPAVLPGSSPLAGNVAVTGVTVRVTPPAYSGLPAETLANPSLVEVLAGSVIEVDVGAVASAVRMQTLNGARDLTSGSGRFQGRFTPESDGFIAFEPRDSAGLTGPRRLIGLAVRQDRAPRVTLLSPGRDLFFSTVPRALDVSISAEDDLALDSLQLRYTAVSGSGERFTFVERSVPLTLSAANSRSWTARGTWGLDQLRLTPGDLVVYHAVARDRRPGAAPAESESYVLEVVTPGAIAAEGFAADDRRDRYAASQQMVILKTERLIARRGALSADSVSDASLQLAAEQRQVRAEFVFMMGGEVEDLAAETAGTLELNEVAEAEAEDDILAGRLQNQGRVEMMRAIRAMSRASTALTDGELDRALRDERTALDNLMRAFSRSRFILRALTQRERIDLERRLSGSLLLTAGLSGPAAQAVPDQAVSTLRDLLVALAVLSVTDSAPVRSRVSDAALAVVRADPASNDLRQLASRIQQLAELPRRPSPAQVDSLVRRVSDLIGAALPLSPNVNSRVSEDVLAGSLRDATRRAGGRR